MPETCWFGLCLSCYAREVSSLLKHSPEIPRTIITVSSMFEIMLTVIRLSIDHVNQMYDLSFVIYLTALYAQKGYVCFGPKVGLEVYILTNKHKHAIIKL